MNDLISRQAAIDALEGWKISGEMILEIVPSADVVEVVRCKDCKNRVDSQLTDCKEPNFCMRLACYANDNDFCSYGEKA